MLSRVTLPKMCSKLIGSRCLVRSCTPYSTFKNSFSTFTRDIKNARISTGQVVPLPRGRIAPLEPSRIVLAGAAVLDCYFENDTPQDHQANCSINAYKRYRSQFLGPCFGMWAAVNETGSLVLAETESFVRQAGLYMFPKEEFYVNCIGCEILQGAYMDNKTTEHSDWNTIFPNGTFTTVHKSEFRVKAQYSFDGTVFNNVEMKYDTGVTHIGVPIEVLSHPPAGVVLTRGEDLISYIPHRQLVRSYEGNFVRIGGLTIKCSFIEARTWLLGFPVISKFLNNTFPDIFGIVTCGYKRRHSFPLEEVSGGN